jgi:hypothetical protein
MVGLLKDSIRALKLFSASDCFVGSNDARRFCRFISCESRQQLSTSLSVVTRNASFPLRTVWQISARDPANSRYSRGSRMIGYACDALELWTLILCVQIGCIRRRTRQASITVMIRRGLFQRLAA